MPGPVQLQWLRNELLKSDATFKVIFSPANWADDSKGHMETSRESRKINMRQESGMQDISNVLRPGNVLVRKTYHAINLAING